MTPEQKMTRSEAMIGCLLSLLDGLAVSACFLAALALTMLLAFDVIGQPPGATPCILAICAGLLVAAFRLIQRAGE